MGMRVYQSVCCGVYSCCAAKHAWPGRYHLALDLAPTRRHRQQRRRRYPQLLQAPRSTRPVSDNTKYAQHADSMGEAA